MGLAQAPPALAALAPAPVALAPTQAALAQVAGKSELALTLLWRERSAVHTVAPTAGPGRHYLEVRRAEFAATENRRSRAESMVERVITELAIDRQLVRHETCTSENVAVSLALLVPTERAGQRKAELEQATAGLEDVTAVLSGPWPPYTFARAE